MNPDIRDAISELIERFEIAVFYKNNFVSESESLVNHMTSKQKEALSLLDEIDNGYALDVYENVKALLDIESEY